MTAWMLALLLAAAEVPETYTVQPGDTCAGIAFKVYGDAKKYTELHQWNELGPLPHHLEVGRVLHLRAPTVASGPEATLTFLKPAVQSRRHLLEWSPAVLHMSLFRLDEVNTLHGAGAEVTFRDLSSLLMDQNALIVIYGAEAPARREQPSGIGLVDGELRLAMASLRAPTTVSTPAASLVATAPSAVVESDAAKTTRLSLFDGKAEVAAQGRKVAVERRHGTRVLQGNPPEPPRPLPGTPQLEGPAVVTVPWEAGGTRLTLAWPAAERAVRYRVQLAKEPRFLDRAGERTTPSTQAAFEHLETGRYYVRAIAYDDIGLQSPPSDTRQVDVVKLPGQVDGEALVQARGEPFAVDVEEDVTVKVDGAAVKPPVTLAVGVHRLELETSDGVVTLSRPLLVPPAPPKVTVDGHTLRLVFSDALPRGQEPQVLGPDGAPLPLTRVDATHFDATAHAAGRHVVRWQSRELEGFELAL